MGRNLGSLIDDYKKLTEELDNKRELLSASYMDDPGMKKYNLMYAECTVSFKKVVDETTVLLNCVSDRLQKLDVELQGLENESESLMHTIKLIHEAGRRRYVGRRILIKNSAYFDNVYNSDSWPVYQRDTVLKINEDSVRMVPVDMAKGVTYELSELSIMRPDNFERVLQTPLYEHGYFSETPANPWLCNKARLLSNSSSQNASQFKKAKTQKKASSTLRHLEDSVANSSSITKGDMLTVGKNVNPEVPKSAASPTASDEFLFKARVLYDYNKTEVDELTVHEGDIVSIVKEFDDGWLQVESKGERGMIPGNYAEKI